MLIHEYYTRLLYLKGGVRNHERQVMKDLRHFLDLPRSESHPKEDYLIPQPQIILPFMPCLHP